jgi:CheY-like chemotaxis protein
LETKNKLPANKAPSECDVLVIDDDPDTVELVLLFFQSKGITAKGLSSSKDYLAAIKESRPKVVLLDVMMPGFNGYNLCTNIKKTPGLKHVAVYFLTAMPPEDVDLHVKACGADGFIAKPFSIDDFNVIQKFLKKR